MAITHKHHIIPKHMGGSDDASNLIELTIEEHAEAHKKLYDEYGKWEDKIAWQMLSGQITCAEATHQAQVNGKTVWWESPENREAYRKKTSGKNNHRYGAKLTDVHKEAIAKANSIAKPHVSENMKKMHADGNAYKFSKSDCSKAGLASAALKKKWYTNGNDNLYIPEGNEIPEGYTRGRTMKWTKKQK